ncbi:WD40 repeat-containing protein [Tieghemostelium lacteum]|uniref:WD40 repeat-containing protein n=1 Tax=Tieghemostelium lacteum TaxID=361077 RepID=A0A151ZA49_TIELA|nr:WD40 repeat-containing protein [Tieghemostelium lacteum]|eukprot:KYQ90817.1 WD40 repeat-containing protein [Tieghemostelium lacteum]
MGFKDDEYQPLPTEEPKEEIIVGDESQAELITIIASPPCESCQREKDINKKRLIIIVPSILQLIVGAGWVTLLGPLLGLIALISKSKFFTILHFISAVLTYLVYSVFLSVATVSCFGNDIGFGIVFAITSVLFLFLFAITLRNYVTYCKILVKKVGECTCESTSAETIVEQPTNENIMRYEVSSSIYPGQAQQLPVQQPQPIQQQQPNPNVLQPIFMNGHMYIPVPMMNTFPQQPQQPFIIHQQPMYPNFAPQQQQQQPSKQ